MDLQLAEEKEREGGDKWPTLSLETGQRWGALGSFTGTNTRELQVSLHFLIFVHSVFNVKKSQSDYLVHYPKSDFKILIRYLISKSDFTKVKFTFCPLLDPARGSCLRKIKVGTRNSRAGKRCSQSKWFKNLKDQNVNCSMWRLS